MKLNDERRKRLTEYLGEPEATSEYTVANSGDLVADYWCGCADSKVYVGG